MLGTDTIGELNHQLFEVRSIPGKGRGLIARFNIAEGKRIVCERPFFTVSSILPVDSLEHSIASKLRALSKSEQQQFFLLHNNFPGKHLFIGIVKTNALPCGPNSATGGVYPTVCLINHSCVPNAHHSWNSDLECETIHAVRYIEAGEEITISYDNGSPSGERHAHLKKAFGFDCSCSLCSLPLPGLRISDSRRHQIQLLDDAIGNPDRVMKCPGACLADCLSLLQVLKDEYQGNPGVLSARLYYDAFQISITHGDQARASVFAERAYKSRVLCEGDDSPETLKVKNLTKNPAGHRNFGVSMRWRTAKSQVPRGLSTDAFEEWLWRQGK